QPPLGDGVPGGPRCGRSAGGSAVKSATVARNYAQALFLAGDARGLPEVERYGRLMEAVAGAVAADERIAVALESPRVSKATPAGVAVRVGAGISAGSVRRKLATLRRKLVTGD